MWGDNILKSCSRCGKIHDSKYICKPQVLMQKNKTKTQKFRSSYAWLTKQRSIRERDLNLCRICLLNLYDTVNRFNYNNLSVHHIIPLINDYSRRLDDDNLITLCRHHHELAEAGIIPKGFLLEEAKHPPTFDEKKFKD